MSKAINLLSKTTGLHNTVSSNRLAVKPEAGITELAAAYNVAIGKSGEPYRRSGLTSTARKEDIHSVFSDTGDGFFVYEDTLYVLNDDFSADSIVTGLTVGLKMAYCQIGNRTYFSNGVQKGCVVNKEYVAWQAASYVGPATHRIFSNPPAGTILTALSGRIYVVSGETAWYSESFAYGWFDLARNFIPFNQPVNMFRAVAGGIYVGLQNRVMFLSGTDPSAFVYTMVSDQTVITGTDIYVEYSSPNGELLSRSVIWTAKDDIFIGQPDGKVINVTDGKIIIPNRTTGCAVYFNNEYISVFQ